MNTYADKTQENKSQSAANTVYQKKSGGEATFQFVDNRPEAIAQRKLQEMANNNPQAKKAAQLQTMADNYSARQQHPIQKKENNTGLPDNLKTGMENLSGMSLDDVKVHRNSDKPAQLQAHAYAQGTDIHLGPGQEKHLPHEGWHVVQQKQGRVKPTMQMKDNVNINDDVGLEKEADTMGEKAFQMKPKENKNGTSANSVTQKKSDEKQAFRFAESQDAVITQRKMLNNIDPTHNRVTNIIQRVINTNLVGAPGGTVITLTAAQATIWIANNCSADLITTFNDPNVNLILDFDYGAVGAHAVTNMRARWTDNIGTVSGWTDMFGPTGGGIFAQAFDNLASYEIEAHIRIQMPTAGATTWEGTLIHELEAHAKSASRIRDKFRTGMRRPGPSGLVSRGQIGANLTRLMDARSVRGEHKAWSKGEGSETSMTKVVKNSPTSARALLVLTDIANDRVTEGNSTMGALRHAAERLRNQRQIANWVKSLVRERPDWTVAEVTAIKTLEANIKARP